MSYQTPPYGAGAMPPGYGAATAQPAPAKRSHAGMWIVSLLALFFFICCAVLFLLWMITAIGLSAGAVGKGRAGLTKQTVLDGGRDEVLLISVRGIITNDESQDLFSYDPGMVRRIKKQLTAAAEDRHIKAVVLEIDSPGGAITACDVIYKELNDFRATGKPLIAYLGDVAASGGYYVACAGDEIVAHPTCLTGSIGVIMPRMNFEGLLKKIGVRVEPIKSGERKDIGAGYREMAEPERLALQHIIDQLHGRFAGIVRNSAKRRGGVSFSDAEFAPLTNGMVFTGADAAKNKLVDATGYLEDAIRSAEKRARISNATVVRYMRAGGIFGSLAGASSAVPRPKASPADALLRSGPRFLYLWTGGGAEWLTAAELASGPK